MYPHLSHSVPRMIPPNQLDGNAPGRTSLDVNLAYDVLGVDISGLSWTPPAPDVSEGKGFEPRYACTHTALAGRPISHSGTPSLSER